MSGNKVDSDLFQNFIGKAMRSEAASMPIFQLRKAESSQKIINMHLRNQLIKKKVVLPTKMQALPYGYTSNMLENISQ